MELQGFDQIEKIGESSRTEIWKARQVSLDRLVCIRRLKQEFTANRDDVQSFLAPAKAASKLKHPNLVQIFDVIERDGQCLVVMEYVSGMLVSHLLVNGPVPQKKALQVAKAVASALDHMRRSNLIHRNVKPSVIALDEINTAKIADIGLATVVDPQGHTLDKSAGLIQGTPNYMSPEQARGSEVLDFRSDMYSLGATLYHMVTGRSPFANMEPEAIIEGHLSGTVSNPRDLDPSISAGTAKIIQRLMMKKPLDRYASWGEAIRDMERVAAGRFLLTGAPDGQRPSTVADPAPTGNAEEAARMAREAAPFSLLLRIAMWLVLAVWLVVLFAYRLGLPMHAIVTGPAPLVPPEPTRPANAVVSPTEAPKTTAGTDGASARSDAEARQIVSLRQEAAELLAARQFGRADARIKAELLQDGTGSYRAQVEDLRRIVHAVADTDRTVAEGFLSKVGRDVTVRVGGREENLLLQAMAGDTVTGTRITGGPPASSNTVTFKLSSLDPIERSRWVGAASTPERAAMKCILYMNGGDYESASAFAANCGPLSDALKTLADQKRAATTQP
jgi:serine/threonine-protein kinase